MQNAMKALAVPNNFILVLTAILIMPIGQAAAQSAPSQTSQGEYELLTADELDGLVAPIALYPDELVAQVLGAATYPYEIVDAVVWLKHNSSLTGEVLMKAVDQQAWDPAVKALTQFPSVLDNLAKNLVWTSSLGEAAATQQEDVMAAIQRMRAKAFAAGNLNSGPEIKVVQESPQTIIIQPANPQIVYVPTYNPTVIYGSPVVVPGYSSADLAAASALSFAAGVAVGAATSGGCCVWGWGYWGASWHTRTIVYHRTVYVGNPYWRGGYYGGVYRPPGYPGYRPPGYRPPSNRPPGYRPPSNPGYPGYGRPPSNRPPAVTLPEGPGNRPGQPGLNPGGRPGGGGPSTRPTNPGGRPGGETPITRPTQPGNRPGGGPSAQPVKTPNTRPRTNESRGYPQTQNSNAPAAQPSKPNAFSGSGGGRPASARGNQSLGTGGNKGGQPRR